MSVLVFPPPTSAHATLLGQHDLPGNLVKPCANSSAIRPESPYLYVSADAQKPSRVLIFYL